MKEFFKVIDIDQVLTFRSQFSLVGSEAISIGNAHGRVLAEDVLSDVNLPDFRRTTMDGYAVKATSSFGASEGNPAYLTVAGMISMGEQPGFTVGPGQAARISTGGMLPEGADSVVMVEHTEKLDEATIEVYKSVAPGQHVIEIGEDFAKDQIILAKGTRLRSPEIGLLAAFGHQTVSVHCQPVIGIISTGDEIVPIHETPAMGQIRDINSHTISNMVREGGGKAITYGIVKDNYDALFSTCAKALSESDMVLISGGSSVGTRDFTVDALSAQADAEILVHGISISPGKPTILAKAAGKPFWGLPGHVVSAMVVFSAVVRPFLEHISGLSPESSRRFGIPARLARNLPSAQGRVDFIRVRLSESADGLRAEPVLGKSGLIQTVVKADGLIRIDRDVEGLEKGEIVSVYPL